MKKSKVCLYATIGVLLTTGSGCSIYGKWMLSSVEPTAADRSVQYNILTLQKDGSFYAEANESTGVKSTSGTFTYKKDILHLTEHNGDQHTFDASMPSNDELKLERVWEGQKLKLKYTRKE